MRNISKVFPPGWRRSVKEMELQHIPLRAGECQCYGFESYGRAEDARDVEAVAGAAFISCAEGQNRRH